jgi:hypothetical protein
MKSIARLFLSQGVAVLCSEGADAVKWCVVSQDAGSDGNYFSGLPPRKGSFTCHSNLKRRDEALDANG